MFKKVEAQHRFGIGIASRTGCSRLMTLSVDVKDERIRCVPTRPQPPVNYVCFRQDQSLSRDQNRYQKRRQDHNRKKRTASRPRQRDDRYKRWKEY
ncbi:hypothetical protein EVAR_96310_1 [Eumeta japonica]|uniref:Uncharacterized protein n=1 Tax=Eumeta variegata TaxID=151549 RepID=A0A4C1VW82_EUMVA|nr:hypothetical protein EVAR_96310_1 [Eumeta japonica]